MVSCSNQKTQTNYPTIQVSSRKRNLKHYKSFSTTATFQSQAKSNTTQNSNPTIVGRKEDVKEREASLDTRISKSLSSSAQVALEEINQLFSKDQQRLFAPIPDRKKHELSIAVTEFIKNLEANASESTFVDEIQTQLGNHTATPQQRRFFLHCLIKTVPLYDKAVSILKMFEQFGISAASEDWESLVFRAVFIERNVNFALNLMSEIDDELFSEKVMMMAFAAAYLDPQGTESLESLRAVYSKNMISEYMPSPQILTFIKDLQSQIQHDDEGQYSLVQKMAVSNLFCDVIFFGIRNAIKANDAEAFSNLISDVDFNTVPNIDLVNIAFKAFVGFEQYETAQDVFINNYLPSKYEKQPQKNESTKHHDQSAKAEDKNGRKQIQRKTIEKPARFEINDYIAAPLLEWTLKTQNPRFRNILRNFLLDHSDSRLYTVHYINYFFFSINVRPIKVYQLLNSVFSKSGRHNSIVYNAYIQALAKGKDKLLPAALTFSNQHKIPINWQSVLWVLRVINIYKCFRACRYFHNLYNKWVVFPDMRKKSNCTSLNLELLEIFLEKYYSKQGIVKWAIRVLKGMPYLTQQLYDIALGIMRESRCPDLWTFSNSVETLDVSDEDRFIIKYRHLLSACLDVNYPNISDLCAKVLDQYAQEPFDPDSSHLLYLLHLDSDTYKPQLLNLMSSETERLLVRITLATRNTEQIPRKLLQQFFATKPSLAQMVKLVQIVLPYDVSQGKALQQHIKAATLPFLKKQKWVDKKALILDMYMSTMTVSSMASKKVEAEKILEVLSTRGWMLLDLETAAVYMQVFGNIEQAKEGILKLKDRHKMREIPVYPPIRIDS